MLRASNKKYWELYSR